MSSPCIWTIFIKKAHIFIVSLTGVFIHHVDMNKKGKYIQTAIHDKSGEKLYFRGYFGSLFLIYDKYSTCWPQEYPIRSSRHLKSTGIY